MKLLLAGLVLTLIVGAHAQWYRFPGEAARGHFLDFPTLYTEDMYITLFEISI